MRKRAKITQLVMKERNVFPQKPNQTKPKTRQTETRQKVEAGYTCGTQRAKTDPHRHSQAGRQLPLGISAQKVRARGFCQGLGNLDGPYREWTYSCTWRSGSNSLLRTLLSIFFFLPFSLSFTLEHCCFCSYISSLVRGDALVRVAGVRAVLAEGQTRFRCHELNSTVWCQSPDPQYFKTWENVQGEARQLFLKEIRLLTHGSKQSPPEKPEWATVIQENLPKDPLLMVWVGLLELQEETSIVFESFIPNESTILNEGLRHSLKRRTNETRAPPPPRHPSTHAMIPVQDLKEGGSSVLQGLEGRAQPLLVSLRATASSQRGLFPSF